MGMTIKDEIYQNISQFEKIIEINDNKIPKDICSKNFLNSFKNKADKSTCIDELIKINSNILGNFGIYNVMCNVNTNNIKKSVLKKIDDEYDLTHYKEVLDLAEEYTDYEDNDDMELDEKAVYTMEEDYFSDEENIWDPYKDILKEDNSKKQGNNNESKEVLKTVDQLIAHNDATNDAKLINPIFYDFLEDTKII